jgi:hypothetical protein
MIRIRSQKDGFRRAGVAHSKEWREYPDDKFSAEQLAALQAEPMLQVEVGADVGGPTDAKAGVKTDKKGK